ncbi:MULTISPECIES: mersacidin family lantibiotic [Bacillus]|uniref:mersacidin family lantibiotic n=1 Tax=Bacillus TaxID=1386 RepID=UPI00032DAC92|nr:MULTISPECIES: mersacidin family lantibiotic [Bacillus cereus group]MBZ3765989.1 mersacidin family lantibiotic [Bacillus cereus]EOO05680.1 type 2 lantibiotic [Bacillus cereus str. Schrouff]EOO81822.1 type 2 lantibiotic [Bacillus cereus K-5975c]MCU4885167.1 mersacidin family lantibiotic [Bacillus cereus]MCU4896412.1 mersacidin family lantibiotic [Bacillus cereus]
MNRNEVIEELAVNHPAGAKLVEVSKEELTRIYAGGDVQPETTPVCAIGGGLALGFSISKIYC